MAVNWSPPNFQNARLAAVVAETLAATGLPPEAFERWLIDYVVGLARMMRERVENARSQPAPSVRMTSTGG